jgi:hypothetical protein
MPLNVAFVIDAGPDQSQVLKKEKDLALAIVNALPAPVSKLLVVRAGYQHEVYPATADRAEATHLIQSLETEEGKKSGIPIFEAMAAAIGELSRLPGMRLLIIIAEGNDYGSSIGYKGLRDLVQARSVVCLVALVDDHPTRGTKSMLRYGWSLQDLANDTAGTFIENSRKLPRTATRFADKDCIVSPCHVRSHGLIFRTPSRFGFFTLRVAAACPKGHLHWHGGFRPKH